MVWKYTWINPAGLLAYGSLWGCLNPVWAAAPSTEMAERRYKVDKHIWNPLRVTTYRHRAYNQFSRIQRVEVWR